VKKQQYTSTKRGRKWGSTALSILALELRIRRTWSVGLVGKKRGRGGEESKVTARIENNDIHCVEQFPAKETTPR